MTLLNRAAPGPSPIAVLLPLALLGACADPDAAWDALDTGAPELRDWDEDRGDAQAARSVEGSAAQARHGAVPCGTQDAGIFRTIGMSYATVSVTLHSECNAPSMPWITHYYDTPARQRVVLDRKWIYPPHTQRFVVGPSQGLTLTCPSDVHETEDDCCAYTVNWTVHYGM